VITAGGTREPIDDVRVVTNLSTGRFGAAIAHALVARGVRVTLLAGDALASRPERIPAGVEVVRFGSFGSLARALDEVLEHPPDLLFMAAAVSDYSPVPATGKLSSGADSLTLHMTRNPKLLDTLRDRCPDTYLVGFKLLSAVTDTELREVARQQAIRCRLDLTLANDLQRLGRDRHPAVLVSPDGSATAIDGTKREAADHLVAHCLEAIGHPHPPQARSAAEWIAHSRTTPILDAGEVVGVLGHHGDSTSIFVFAHARGRGIGDRVVESISGPMLATEDAVSWFVERGFLITRREPPLVLLEPPTARQDLIPSASVCLIDPTGQQVLIGRRKTTTFHGFWAFPGGTTEPGETARDCALRELAEETGLTPSVDEPVAISTVHVSEGAGKRAWRVTNFAWTCAEQIQPVETEELEATWVPIDQLATLRPMAAGTKRVLRKLLASLAGKK